MIEKLDMKTPDFTTENIAQIAALFPNCLTETKDTKGNIKKAIDFDLLKQELSENIVDGAKERYSLNWPGKKEALVTANKPINKTLRPDVDDSVNFDTTQNLYIEGDNLEALKLLQESYLNKIKIIYIDPPYNTGDDFLYCDNFTIDKDEELEASGQKSEEGRLVANLESNGRYHSDWLSMMYPRLKLARNLLKEDGIIFISIDDNEVSNLKKIANEIFGEENFIGNVTWEKRTKAQNTKTARDLFQSKTEYILVYKRGSDKYRFNLEVTGTKTYDLKDDKGEYRLKVVEEMSAVGMRARKTMIFPILDIMPGNDKQWKVGRDEINKYLVRNDVIIDEGKPYLKVRPDDENVEKFKPFWSHFFDKDTYGTAESGKSELTEILGTNKHEFETVKPTKLLKKLFFHIKQTNEIEFKNDDIILDFFSGSATTAQAVMELNAEDNGNRKFILVQVDEKTDLESDAYEAGFKSIIDIGKTRIKKATEKIIEKYKDKENIFNLDIGFRVLKIDSSNMNNVYYSPDEITQDSLFDVTVDNIKPDRKPLDLLFQVLLDSGVDLTLPIVKKEILGKEVYFVDENVLVACFENRIDEALVTQIAKMDDILKVVFKDSSFQSDDMRINVEQIFKQYSPDTQLKVI